MVISPTITQCASLLDLLAVLLEVPEGDSTAVEGMWRVLLALAVETGEHGPLPRITSNRYLASLRRIMGLPSALRHELKRLSEATHPDPKPSRPLSLIWKLSLTAAGLPQASTTLISQGK